MADPIDVIIIPTTHLDREWYLDRLSFQWRLDNEGGVIDTIVEFLENNPEAKFALDGQVIPLLDYLDIRPDMVYVIRSLAKEGRLALGPNYILPDEMLIPQVALLENLRQGMKIARSYGNCYDVAYCPDAFGHPAQLPQIFANLGFRGIPMWRGLWDTTEKDPEYRALAWEALDGTLFPAFRLCESMGYSNAIRIYKEGDDFFVGDDPRRPGKRLEEVIESEAAKHPLKVVVLMNGTDHTHAQIAPYDQDIAALVAEMNKRFDGKYRFGFGTFSDYFDKMEKAYADLGQAVESGAIKKIEGELLDGTTHTLLLPGIASSRLRQIKQPMFEIHNGLAAAEATAAIAALAGYKPTEGFFDRAWRRFLETQPHDSVGGCSVDQVHRDMEPRFSEARRIVNLTTTSALEYLAGAKASPEIPTDADYMLSVLNPTHVAREFIISEFELSAEYGAFKLSDSSGTEIPYQIIGADIIREPKDTRLRFPQNKIADVTRYKVLISVGIDPFGKKEITIKKDDNTISREHPQEANVLENDHLHVVIDSDGTLTLTDKSNGRSYSGLNQLRDVGDRGDGYNFSHLEGDSPITPRKSANIELVFSGGAGIMYRIDRIMDMPLGLDDENRDRRIGKKETIVRSYVTLPKDSHMLLVDTQFDNKSEDHRLRAVFPTGLDIDTSYAATQFGCVEREIAEPIPIGTGRVEESIHAYPHQGWFAVQKDGEAGLGIVAMGLPEYEAMPNKGDGVSLELTLLRSVGWLSRGDLLTRYGNAGPDAPAPEGQELGEHSTSYAIVPLHGDDWATNMFNQAAIHNTVLPSIATPIGEAPQYVQLGSLPDGLQMAELRKRGSHIYLTAFNPTENPIGFDPRDFHDAAEVFETDLNFKAGNPVTGPLEIAPGRIVAYGFALK